MEKTHNFQTAAVATGAGVPANAAPYDFCVFQVFGITTATVTWQANVDGTNWVDIRAVNMASGAAATTATADGLFQLDMRGLMNVRANITAYTSGTITVLGNLITGGL